MTHIRTLLTLLLIIVASDVRAASLQVYPVQLEVQAPGAASKLTLRNLGPTAVTAQIRFFRWQQRNGKDELVETRDVVASPPIANIAAGAEQLIRVVRVTKAPIAGEESYRVLIDEIPAAVRTPGSSISFAVRYSVPVFFSEPSPKRSPLLWAASYRNGTLSVSAGNRGGRRVRIAALKMMLPNGDTVSFGEGLTGYVLANSVATWSMKSSAHPRSQNVAISAVTEDGPMQDRCDLQTLP